MFTDYGRFVTRLFRIPRRTKLAGLTQTYAAFIISGLLHAQASYCLRAVPPFTSFYDRFTCLFIFFFLQAVGITIEDLAISTYKALHGNSDTRVSSGNTKDSEVKSKIGPKGSQYLWWAPWMGRVWVISWGLFTAQWALNAWLKTEQGMITMPGFEQGSMAGTLMEYLRSR